MNLQQFLRILKARWLLVVATLLITVGATVAVSLMIPPRYTSSATVVVDVKSQDPISGALMPLLPMTGLLATQVDIIKSHTVARRAVDLLKLAENPAARELYLEKTGGRGNVRDWLADELILRYLAVEPSRESSVVSISYTGSDPRFATAVANAVVQAYVTTNLDLKIAPARQTNAFFNEQIKGLKDNLERSQQRLSEYQRDKGITATDERLDVETARLNDLSSQLVLAQSQLADAMSRKRQVDAALARGEIPDTVPDVVANPVIQGLKANLTALESKLNEYAGKVGKNHPQYQTALSDVANVRSRLAQEMKTVAQTVSNSAALSQRREEQIKASLGDQRQKVLQMKQVRDDLAVLLREVENTQRTYDAAMARMTQTRLESQSTQTNVLVINEAIEPIEPSFPKLPLNIALAVILGAMLAVGFALLRELSDRIVRSEVDLAEGLGLPVLGVLGREKRGWRRRRRTPSSAVQTA